MGSFAQKVKHLLARELKGLAAGLAAGLGVVAAAYGVSAIAMHAQTPETKPPARAVSKPAATVASSQIVATGVTLYKDSCAGCHGSAAQGNIGPNLHHLGDPDAKIAANIKRGYPGRMPGFKDQYNDTQINALVAYLQTLE